MYLHLGGGTVVPQAEIIGIFDMDNATVMKISRDFLHAAQLRGEIFEAVALELPKSFVVTGRGIFLTPLGTATLQKRCNGVLGVI